MDPTYAPHGHQVKSPMSPADISLWRMPDGANMFYSLLTAFEVLIVTSLFYKIAMDFKPKVNLNNDCLV